MSISDQQDGGECEVGTGVGHRVHHLPAWRHPDLLEGGDADGGQDHDMLLMVIKIMMIKMLVCLSPQSFRLEIL